MKKQLTQQEFNHKVIRIIFTFLKPAFWFMGMKLQHRNAKRQKVIAKVKHFKPTVHEGLFYNTVSWQMRDKPLTDNELKNLRK